MREVAQALLIIQKMKKVGELREKKKKKKKKKREQSGERRRKHGKIRESGVSGLG